MSAGSIIQSALPGLNASNPDGTISIRLECLLPVYSEYHVGFSLLRGGSGIRSDIGRNGVTVFLRQQQDTESVRASALFDLPPLDHAGTAALHVPHSMGYKSVLESTLRTTFTSHGFTFRLTPVVPIGVYEEAVRQGHVKKMTLLLHGQRHEGLSRRYGGAGGANLGRVTVGLESSRGGFLNLERLQQYFRNRSRENLQRLLEFQDLVFDEAKVQVELPNGIVRSFNVESVEGGHPISIDLNLTEDDTGFDIGPSIDDLADELYWAIRAVSEDDGDHDTT